MTVDDVGTLACPACRAPLTFDGTTAGGELLVGAVCCGGCPRTWPVEETDLSYENDFECIEASEDRADNECFRRSRSHLSSRLLASPPPSVNEPMLVVMCMHA
jgi:hypothetical protein